MRISRLRPLGAFLLTLPFLHGDPLQSPGMDPQALRESRNVPRGTVHVNWYESPAWGGKRRFHVYTPPGYELGNGKYPALYLLHDDGGTDGDWIETGKANVILDNLVAQGKLRPMIVVMPDGRPPAPISVRGSEYDRRRQEVLLEKELTTGVIPAVDSLYRTEPFREFRAIAGPAIGGRQALHLGLRRLDLFSRIGVFSSGVEDEQEFITDHETVLTGYEETNRQMMLLWIACGERDEVRDQAERLDAILRKYQVGHYFHRAPDGPVWTSRARYLAEFATLLF